MSKCDYTDIGVSESLDTVGKFTLTVFVMVHSCNNALKPQFSFSDSHDSRAETDFFCHVALQLFIFLDSLSSYVYQGL